MTSENKAYAVASPLPASLRSALYAPAGAMVAWGAAMLRWQMSIFEAWSDLARAPYFFGEALRDSDVLKVAMANAANPPDAEGATDEKEEALDEAIEDSFPASDPPSHNPGTASPSAD